MLTAQIGVELGLPQAFIEKLARSASYRYREYTIKKRDGRDRVIHHPSKPLKAIQRWLVRRVIARFPVHPAAMAYRRGYNTLKNAREHAKGRYLLRADLSDFFHSITAKDIEAFFIASPDLFVGWTLDDCRSFCDLICRDGRLTIGAPTSPAISNAICMELDNRLSALATGRSMTYTRYADDLFFSSMIPGTLSALEPQIAGVLRRLPYPQGLALNAEKTRHASRRGRRKVTGLTLGSDGEVYVGRSHKRRVRALVHRYERLDPDARASLAGLIAYMIGVDPDFLNALVLKYGHERITLARFGE